MQQLQKLIALKPHSGPVGIIQEGQTFYRSAPDARSLVQRGLARFWVSPPSPGTHAPDAPPDPVDQSVDPQPSDPPQLVDWSALTKAQLVDQAVDLGLGKKWKLQKMTKATLVKVVEDATIS